MNSIISLDIDFLYIVLFIFMIEKNMEENNKYKKGLINGKSIQHVCNSFSELDNFQYSKPQDFVNEKKFIKYEQILFQY